MRQDYRTQAHIAPAGIALILLLLGFSTALADELRCPSIGGSVGEAPTEGTNRPEASQFSVGHALVGSVMGGTHWLHAGVMHCYVPPLYKGGLTWNFRRDYSATEDPAGDLSAITRPSNFDRSNYVYTEAVWFYECNTDGAPDGSYDRADRGVFMGWDSWTCDETVGPALIDELEPPQGAIPEWDRGLYPMVTGPGQAVVHWHSPVKAMVQIRGIWINRSDAASDDGMHWSIRRNAEVLPLMSGTLPSDAPGAITPFVGPLWVNVAVGDRVYFLLGNNGNAIGDGATLRARIRVLGWAWPIPWGDVDGDGDVDLIDFSTFSTCLAGPGILPEPVPGSEDLDFDLDEDVDLRDFAAFQVAFTGENPDTRLIHSLSRDGDIDPRTTEAGGISQVTLTFNVPVRNQDGSPLSEVAFAPTARPAAPCPQWTASTPPPTRHSGSTSAGRSRLPSGPG